MAVVRNWLPYPEVKAALSEEPRRFKAIFKALEADWRAQGLSTSIKNAKLMEWLSHIERYKHLLLRALHAVPYSRLRISQD